MQEIDRDVGFPHRAILYRIGSRDGFTHALAQDVVDVLEADVRTALARPTADVVSELEHVVATLPGRGPTVMRWHWAVLAGTCGYLPAQIHGHAASVDICRTTAS